MRISDWSSDVCSSDLVAGAFTRAAAGAQEHLGRGARRRLAPLQVIAVDRRAQFVTRPLTEERRELLANVADRSLRAARRRSAFGRKPLDLAVYLAAIGRASCRERGCQSV